MTPHMVELCVKGYLKYGAAGVTMKVIYTQTMKFIFGCKTRRDQDGCFQYYQPNGEPFPSSRQFRYWVTKEFSLKPSREPVSVLRDTDAASVHQMADTPRKSPTFSK